LPRGKPKCALWGEKKGEDWKNGSKPIRFNKNSRQVPATEAKKGPVTSHQSGWFEWKEKLQSTVHNGGLVEQR